MTTVSRERKRERDWIIVECVCHQINPFGLKKRESKREWERESVCECARVK